MLKRNGIAVVAVIGVAAALLVYGEAAATRPRMAPTVTAAAFTTGAAPIATAAKQAKKLTRAEKLKKALKACKKDKSKTKRKACEKKAENEYGKKPTSPTKTGTGTTTGGAAATGTTAGGAAATGTTAGGAAATGTTAGGAAATGTTAGGAAATGTTAGGAAATGTTAGGATGTTAGGATGTTAGTGTTTGTKTPGELREEAELATLAKEAPSNTQTAAHVSAGMALYNGGTCSSCHGLHGEGEHEGPGLAGLPRAESVKGVVEQLIMPIGPMPNYDENYTFAEKEALGAYICVEFTKKCTG